MSTGGINQGDVSPCTDPIGYNEIGYSDTVRSLQGYLAPKVMLTSKQKLYLVLGPYTKTQPLSLCQHDLRNKLLCHPAVLT